MRMPIPLMVIAAILAGCAAPAVVPLVVTLPMDVPATAAPGPKHEPLPVGASAEVPAGIGTVDLARLHWTPERQARIVVEWPEAGGLRLMLRADGRWDPAARVRVLDVDGMPLHIDSWAPAERREWWSATAEGCCMIVEIDGPPGDAAQLRIVRAAAMQGRR